MGPVPGDGGPVTGLAGLEDARGDGQGCQIGTLRINFQSSPVNIAHEADRKGSD